MIKRREIFRWLVDTFDGINFWFQDKFNINPKRRALETMQDAVSVEELECTIGKSLGIVE
jgi:hypothetical protein